LKRELDDFFNETTVTSINVWRAFVELEKH